jgi:hypothetical protein
MVLWQMVLWHMDPILNLALDKLTTLGCMQ